MNVNEALIKDYPNLATGDDLYSGKLAAKNIRSELKKAFPQVKFSVRKSHFGCIVINWDDGATPAQVEKIAKRYKIGNYGDDSTGYVYNYGDFQKLFGGVEYIQYSRFASPKLIEKAIEKVFLDMNIPEFLKPSGADYILGNYDDLITANYFKFKDEFRELVVKTYYGLEG